jgi:hypothetical protein
MTHRPNAAERLSTDVSRLDYGEVAESETPPEGGATPET